MTDIEKALEYGKKCYSFFMDGDVTPEEYDTAFLYSILVAEKKRADEIERLQAENARLREAVNDAHRFLSEFKVVSDEDSMGSAFFTARTSEDWYYILLDKLSSLSQKPPTSRDNPGEIDPHGVEYGVFKLDGEFPS